MAAAGQRLIGDRFTPDALGTVLDAAYRSGPEPPRPRPAATFAVARIRVKARRFPHGRHPDHPGSGQ